MLWPRWTPVVVSFAVVLTAYWLYALIVVPWIEPSISLQTRGAAEELFQESDQERKLLEVLFAPGAWELDQPKVFESRQTKLLFKDYAKQRPNAVELRPCTLIFVPDEPDLSAAERYRRAVVMEVPEGALLEFDQPVDLTQARMGRLVQGHLRGPVRIRSQGRSVGPEDDLRITTREVRISQKEITTSEKVECYWGPHFARGQQLRIELTAESPTPSGFSLGGIQTLEVQRVELVHFVVPAQAVRSLPGRASPAARASLSSTQEKPSSGSENKAGPESRRLPQPAASSSSQAPVQTGAGGQSETLVANGSSVSGGHAEEQATSSAVAEITCRGPFRFHTKNLEASFSDQVLVRYTSPDGLTDSLQCDRLLVVFKAQRVSAAKKILAQTEFSGAANAEQPSDPKGPSTSGKPPASANQPSDSSPTPKDVAKTSAQPNFESKGQPKSPVAEPAKRASFSSTRLEPERLQAIGRPAILEAPSRQTRAVAERLEYHLPTGRLLLQASQDAWICHGFHEIHAPKLDYTPGPAGQLGQGSAEGAGWLRSQADAHSGQSVHARWNQTLQLRPHQGQPLLSLLGQAEVRHTGIGQLTAEQIHLWLKHHMGADQPPSRQILVPDRLLAEEKVQLRHAQVTALVDRLEVWFEMAEPTLPPLPVRLTPPMAPKQSRSESKRDPPLLHFVSYPPLCLGTFAPVLVASALPGDGRRQFLLETHSNVQNTTFTRATDQLTAWPELVRSAANALPAPISDSTLPSTEPPSANSTALPPQIPMASGQTLATLRQESARQFEVRSKLLRALVVLAGQQSELKELILQGDVFLHETQTGQPEQQPLVVTGQQIHVVDASRPYLALTVEGQPAHVEARGLALHGPKINLHRGTNRLWIDGPGWMSLPMDRDLQGRPTGRTDTVQIHWQHRMEFDGRWVRFEDSVLASSPGWQLRTDSLEVQLQEPIAFTATRHTAHPKLHRLICRSDVLLEARSWDAQGQLSQDQVEAGDLTVDLITGDLIASGPGLFRSVRRSSTKPEAPLQEPTKEPTGQQRRQPNLLPIRPDVSATGLVFLCVEFHRSLVGNLHRREISFTDRVRTIYGPVSDWQERINWGQRAVLPPQVVFLSCDQLLVAEWTLPPSGQRFLELAAVGNTLIESAGYMARAHRLSYTEHKGLVVLEGDGRTDAELFRQPRLGAPRERVAARKIYYWPATNHLSLDSASLLEVIQPEKK
ncbi:MAG: hypothetical protein NZ602_09290 [Thermoguttaceae bacterium]|nr:hypothetical protein [Thermoguttaceae bacterium]MDW8038431.1 hypothetical protein [Thermoguttaceae bacterium]